MALKTPEKLQSLFLLAAFLFIAYAVYVSVSKAIAARDYGPGSAHNGPLSRPAPVRSEKAMAHETETAKAEIKHLDAAIRSHPKDAKNYVSRAQLKADLGDCSGASQDYSRAQRLDSSLQDQPPPGLDACKQK